MTLRKNWDRRRRLEKAICDGLLYFRREPKIDPNGDLDLERIGILAARFAMDQIEKEEGDA